MPDEKTRADSLREYLTGAISEGGAQADPNASLGDYRSSTEAESMAIEVTLPLTTGAITIDYAGGGNEDGQGLLDVVDSNTVQWKCFGESYGPTVQITNGETKIVETGDLPGAYLRISRTSATALSGTAGITLAKKINNVFAFDDVSSSEASSGDDEYRATIVKNESVAAISTFKRWLGLLGTARISDTDDLPATGAGTIESSTVASFADWPEQGWCHIKNGSATREIVYYTERTNNTLTVPSWGRGLLSTSEGVGAATDTISPVPGVRIGIDPDGIQDAGYQYQKVANESTEPSGVTWDTGITDDTGLVIGNMESGKVVCLWIHREIPAGAVATTNNLFRYEDSFDAA